MIMLENIEAVIFDLDGTLIDSMWVWKEIDIEYLRQKGHELPDDLQHHIEGMSFTETAVYFKERFRLRGTIEEIKREWHSMAEDYYKHKISLKKGVGELLKIMKQRGLKLGIGTSNSQELTKEILTRHQIFHYFDAIATSCEVKKGKPHPDVFLKVAERLNVIPEKCLVFEDTYAGVRAAKSAGMKVVAVEDEASLPNKEEITKIADHYISHFIEITKDHTNVG